MTRRTLIGLELVLLAALVLGVGCDREDNDWHLYDPELKAVTVLSDTLFTTEEGTAATFTVDLEMVPDDTVFVYLAPADSQVTVEPSVLVFAPVDDEWLDTRSVTVLAVDDSVDEGPHTDQVTVRVESTDPAYEAFDTGLPIPVAVTDNDLAGVLISETYLTLVESDGGVVRETYRVRLASQPTADVTVSTAYLPLDPSFHIEPPSLTFTPETWDQLQEILLWVELDDVDNDNQTMTLSHAADSSDPNYTTALAIPDLEVAVFDDTMTPIARLNLAVPGPGDLLESNTAGTLDLIISLNHGSQTDVVVHIATLAGTALAGSDFVPLNLDVTFPVGGPLTQTITVAGLDDTVMEPREDFEVVLTAVGNVIIGDDDRVTLTVVDDDQTTLAMTVLDRAEDSGNADFVISLPQAQFLPVSFTFRTANGTALSAEDYQASNISFTLEPGDVSVTVPVVFYADPTWEEDEIFTASLVNLSANATWDGIPVACTILNDDPQVLGLTGPTLTESDGVALFTLTLAAPYDDDVHLTVSTLPGDGLGAPSGQEDAVGGSDYTTQINANWRIPAHSTTATFVVPVTNNATPEALNEIFRLTVVTSDHAGFQGLEAPCTIVDDDQPLLWADNLQADEWGADAVFLVGLRNAAGNFVVSDADVTFFARTAGVTADEGEDFTVFADTVTIAAGTNWAQVPVPLADDLHDDDDETLVLVLTDHVNAAGNYPGLAPYCLLVDNEFPSVHVEPVALNRYNEGTTLDFRVRLTTPREVPTDFDLVLAAGTSGGHMVDYTFTGNGTHALAPFQTEMIFSVPFLDDALAGEPDEVLQIDISNTNVALGATHMEATIVDAPQLNISGSGGNEGDVADFIAALSAVSTADVTFTVQYGSGSAISGFDFDATNTGPFTIPAGSSDATVSVPLLAGDGGDHAVEDFVVTLINPDNATNGPFNSAIGLITDMDPPVLTWAGTASAVEGTDIVFTVDLSWASNVDISFEVTFADGTANRAGIDYDDADTGPFVVPAGQTSFNVSVPTVADGDPELAAEDFTISLVSPVDAVIGPPSTTGYVQDADQPELNIAAAGPVTEGGQITFTVSLSVQTIVPVTFELEYENGSTQGAGDFDATNIGPFTILPGGTNAVILVDTFDDAVHENMEAFIIRVANLANAVPGPGFETTGVINDDDP